MCFLVSRKAEHKCELCALSSEHRDRGGFVVAKCGFLGHLPPGAGWCRHLTTGAATDASARRDLPTSFSSNIHLLLTKAVT